MTGAIDLYNNAIGHAQFAASRAPSTLSMFSYSLLGAGCSLAFELGAKHRPLNFKALSLKKDAPSPQIFPTSFSIIDGLAVVIPALVRTTKEVELLQEAIRAIGNEATVIVVDDGSPLSLEPELSGCHVVRHNENQGPAAARNTGTSLALNLGASCIAFTDSDCVPESGWAKAHKSLQEKTPGIWAGRTIASNDGMVADFHDRVGTLMPRLRTPTATDALYAPTCNLSISREVAQSIRFDQSFPTSAFEDVDFCLRANGHFGQEVNISDQPIIRHSFEPGWFGLMKTYHKYGRSYPLLLKRHPGYEEELQRSMPMSALLPTSTSRMMASQPFVGEVHNSAAAKSLIAWTNLISCVRGTRLGKSFKLG